MERRGMRIWGSKSRFHPHLGLPTWTPSRSRSHVASTLPCQAASHQSSFLPCAPCVIGPRSLEAAPDSLSMEVCLITRGAFVFFLGPVERRLACPCPPTIPWLQDGGLGPRYRGGIENGTASRPAGEQPANRSGTAGGLTSPLMPALSRRRVSSVQSQCSVACPRPACPCPLCPAAGGMEAPTGTRRWCYWCWGCC